MWVLAGRAPGLLARAPAGVLIPSVSVVHIQGVSKRGNEYKDLQCVLLTKATCNNVILTQK